MKQIHTSRSAALFVLLAAMLLAAGCGRSVPEAAVATGQTQASAAATATTALPDGAVDTDSPASAAPSPQGTAASPAGTSAIESVTAGPSGAATGSAVPSSDGSGTGGGAEGAVAPSASAAVPSPPAVPTKPSGGGATATAKPSAAAQASPSPSPAATQPPQTDEVTLSVVGDGDTGTILAPAAVELKKGDSVLDVLKRATRSRKMQMEYQGKGAAAYVEGIDNLYEFDKGAKSGWLFRVNGEFPGESAGAYKLKAGDTVEWLYTLDLGKDVGKGADDKESAS